MRFSQSAFFQLACASFIAGLMLSLVYDIFYCTRIWLIPSQARYAVPAIQKMRSSRIKKGSASKPKLLPVVVFFGDVFFCIMGAITLILLLYWLNNGIFRATAPLLMTIGFFLCHISASRKIRIAMQWVAFGTETLIYTLCIPIKRLMCWIIEKHQKNARIKHQKRCAKKRETYTKQQFQSIGTTAEKLLSINKNRMRKGDSYAKCRKKAI